MKVLAVQYTAATVSAKVLTHGKEHVLIGSTIPELVQKIRKVDNKFSSCGEIEKDIALVLEEQASGLRDSTPWKAAA